eukprot:TRINITY_DN10895_c0_g2_i10.p1 TRINITY_DN10895_c0_g2~~TRINITY_DN10895_c0_g2_i10.p1  ORF type:complete len:536 (+),score=83.68 TRINITY_DN10895_c0_g2_i10:466-2073(+)
MTDFADLELRMHELEDENASLLSQITAIKQALKSAIRDHRQAEATASSYKKEIKSIEKDADHLTIRNKELCVENAKLRKSLVSLRRGSKRKSNSAPKATPPKANQAQLMNQMVDKFLTGVDNPGTAREEMSKGCHKLTFMLLAIHNGETSQDFLTYSVHDKEYEEQAVEVATFVAGRDSSSQLAFVSPNMAHLPECIAWPLKHVEINEENLALLNQYLQRSAQNLRTNFFKTILSKPMSSPQRRCRGVRGSRRSFIEWLAEICKYDHVSPEEICSSHKIVEFLAHCFAAVKAVDGSAAKTQALVAEVRGEVKQKTFSWSNVQRWLPKKLQTSGLGRYDQLIALSKQIACIRRRASDQGQELDVDYPSDESQPLSTKKRSHSDRYDDEDDDDHLSNGFRLEDDREGDSVGDNDNDKIDDDDHDNDDDVDDDDDDDDDRRVAHRDDRFEFTGEPDVTPYRRRDMRHKGYSHASGAASSSGGSASETPLAKVGSLSGIIVYLAVHDSSVIRDRSGSFDEGDRIRISKNGRCFWCTLRL